MTERLVLVTHTEAAAVARQRAALRGAVRSEFEAHGFVEADPPVLLPHAGQEPHLHPPAVELPGLAGTLYLQTSPELPLKRLLCAGLERLYSMGPAFRAGREELSTHHAPEFCMLEWYEPGRSVQVLVDRCRSLGAAAARALGVPSPGTGQLLDVAEAFRSLLGLDLEPLLDGDLAGFARAARGIDLELRPQDGSVALFSRVVVERLEPALRQQRGWVFLHGYPAALAALAQLDPADPRRALRVEAYLGGVELANGYVELTDADEMARRWRAEAAERVGPALPRDEALLQVLGVTDLAPTVGMALGIDRLLMVLLGKSRLDEVLPLSLAWSTSTHGSSGSAPEL